MTTTTSGIFRERIPSDGSTEKSGMALLFSVTYQHLFELLKLNLLFILLCLPIITIPAALTAMGNVTLKIIREEVFFFGEDFWGVFRKNFGKSLIIGLPAGLILAASVFVITFYRAALSISLLNYVPLVIAVITVVMVLFVGAYAFPMLSTIDLPLGKILRNSLILALMRLPYNAAAFLGIAFIWLLTLVTLPVSLLIIISCLFSLSSLISSFCVWSGIRKYILKGG